jgi:hypothetical protein
LIGVNVEGIRATRHLRLRFALLRDGLDLCPDPCCAVGAEVQSQLLLRIYPFIRACGPLKGSSNLCFNSPLKDPAQLIKARGHLWRVLAEKIEQEQLLPYQLICYTSVLGH